MAKTRAQRKAEQRRRREQQQQRQRDAASESQAQHDTQVPESADVIEAELAEQGADLEALRRTAEREPATVEPEPATAESEALAPSRADVGKPPQEAEPEGADRISRRARRRAERERREVAKESERRRAPREEPVERQRGAVMGFLASCWAELKRVQWPDRDTLIQASAITLIFITVMAAYLGVLDAIFNWLVKAIL